MKKRNLQRKRQQRNVWAMNNKPELEVLEDKDIPLNVIVINQEVKAHKVTKWDYSFFGWMGGDAVKSGLTHAEATDLANKLNTENTDEDVKYTVE